MFKKVSFINAGAVTGSGYFNTDLIISIMPGGEGSAVGSVIIPFGGQAVAVAETPDYFVGTPEKAAPYDDPATMAQTPIAEAGTQAQPTEGASGNDNIPPTPPETTNAADTGNTTKRR